MTKTREFVPIRELIGAGPTRSMLEDMARPGEVVKIDKNPIISYVDSCSTKEYYSVIAEKNGVIVPPGFVIAVVKKVKNTRSGKTAKYRVTPTRDIFPSGKPPRHFYCIA